jgi:hypothetical protein
MSVAHAFNVNYLGSRDQEDHSSRAAKLNRPGNPTVEILNIKKVDRVT